MATKTPPKPRASKAVAPAARRRKTKEPTKSPRDSASPIDAYLEGIDHAAARATLTRLCEQLRELLPTATETISYNMPAFRMPDGKVAAGFAFFGKNCGYYPHSGNVVPKLGALVDGYKATRGGIAFPPDAPLPKRLVSALVRTRLAELAQQEPASKKAKAPAKPAGASKPTAAASPKKPRVFAIPFASVYPLYVQKAANKGRTQREVDEVIAWLTGYRGKTLERALADQRDLEAFFNGAPRWNPKATLITGVVCGIRVEQITDPLMQKIRYLDKLVDELARGKKMESILRR